LRTNVNRTLYFVLVINIAAMVILILGGILTKSLAVLVGGAEAGINVLSLSFLLYFVRKSAMPPDRDHPYGHYKYENISAFVTSIFMSSAAMFILISSIGRISSPVSIESGAIYFAVLSLVLPLISFSLLLWTAKRTGAIAVAAETRHLLVDAADSLIILTGVVLAIEFNPVFDALSALIVSLVFIYGIVMNIKTAIPSLIDEGLPSQFVDEVKKISLTVNGVRDAHMVRSRKTPRGYFIDMHLLLDPNMPLGEAHEVVDKVERKIKESITSIVIADLVIHMEPYLSNGHE